jgi:UrcA family protein
MFKIDFATIVAPLFAFSAVAATAALCAAALPSPAAAEPARHSVTIRYADLDLTAPAGRRTLDRRIGHA